MFVHAALQASAWSRVAITQREIAQLTDNRVYEQMSEFYVREIDKTRRTLAVRMCGDDGGAAQHHRRQYSVVKTNPTGYTACRVVVIGAIERALVDSGSLFFHGHEPTAQIH